jgi:hypothetical protein
MLRIGVGRVGASLRGCARRWLVVVVWTFCFRGRFGRGGEGRRRKGEESNMDTCGKD